MPTPVHTPVASCGNPLLDEMKLALDGIRAAKASLTRSIVQSGEIIADARRALAVVNGLLELHETALLDIWSRPKLMLE
jgi:hypothetical protein